MAFNLTWLATPRYSDNQIPTKIQENTGKHTQKFKKNYKWLRGSKVQRSNAVLIQETFDLSDGQRDL